MRSTLLVLPAASARVAHSGASRHSPSTLNFTTYSPCTQQEDNQSSSGGMQQAQHRGDTLCISKLAELMT